MAHKRLRIDLGSRSVTVKELGNLTSEVTLTVRTLLIYVAQVAARCTQHVSDGDFREQPVGWNDRIKLCNRVIR
jgi:hypothetical protein